MELHYTGVIIAICTFFIIGCFHPIVIKIEYYYGTKPWWIFMIAGIASIFGAFCVADVLLSSLLGVLGASLLWSIGELFSQRKRVEKGWFPMNPKRKNEYEKIDPEETLCPVRKGKTIYRNTSKLFEKENDQRTSNLKQQTD